MSNKQHILEGRTIEAVQIADDKRALRFVTDQGEVIARADGDCCSESWVEHVELPARGFPAYVTSAHDVEMPEPDQGNYECLQAYGFRITTDKGVMLIEYRNESNGYYGGDLVWPDEGRFYGGVFGQNESAENWVEVRD